MERKDDHNNQVSSPLPIPSSADLRGRQSVRATFRLTQKAINSISIVAKHLGIKQKSLLDHFIADYRTLDFIAERLQDQRLEVLDRVQKTYVISRKTLSFLAEVSKKFDTSRDTLVEYSVQRLLPIIAEERERVKKREKILEEFEVFFRQGEEILKECRKTLGEEDPVYERMKDAIEACRDVAGKIRSFVEKGRAIEAMDQEDGESPPLAA